MARLNQEAYTLYFDKDFKKDFKIACINLNTDIATVLRELANDFVKKYKENV